MSTPAQILRHLAALAPRRRADSADGDALAKAREPVVVGDLDIVDPGIVDPDTASTLVSAAGIDRLAAVGALDPRDDAVRVGAWWLVGTVAGEARRFPAVVRRVRLSASDAAPGAAEIAWLSDPELHPLLADVADVATLDLLTGEAPPPAQPAEPAADADPALAIPSRGELVEAAVVELCDRAGLGPVEVPAAGDVGPDPTGRRAGHDGLRLSRHVVAYAVEPAPTTTVAASLLRWADQPLTGTAFAHLYDVGGEAGGHDDEGDDSGGVGTGVEEIESPLPVNARQRDALRRARTDAVSVVSGPPGTGKTHLVVAVAVDAVARGESVLIATQSDHAAQSVCEVLDRHPSTPYLRFGRAEHRRRVAERLASGGHGASTDAEVDAARAAEQAARDRMRSVETLIRAALVREGGLTDGLRRRDALGVLTADAPGVLAADVDLVEAHELAARAADSGGFLARRRAGRAERRLRRLVQARPGTTLDTIVAALEVAQAERDVAHALATGGTTLDAQWAELDAAEHAWREALAELVDVRRRHAGWRRRRRARASVAALATVLRTGVARRAELLADLDTDAFLDLLPLWVGTLDEVERTLPAVAGLFDLVILDEASQIDQLQAAGALCRADRTIVVGDPRQLRHVSFVADQAMDDALAGAGIDDPSLRRLLDVRRNSIFDVAAAAAPVTLLDEHFRSVPHLIAFSAEHFYDGALRLMTQHPSVESHDAIDLVAVDGHRVDGVNVAEVDMVCRLLEEALASPASPAGSEGGVGGRATIGVITPFRDQADAIEAAVLDRFSLSDIGRLGLRIGTVHGFQGSERDTVIVSLAMGPDDLGRSLRFVEDPGLFNVMVTRARRRMVMLHSFDTGAVPAALLAGYLRTADDPPQFVPQPARTGAWTRGLADALGGTDLRVVADYPVAGWTVDLALGSGPEAVGVECRLHPDGVDAHIERHLTLRRAGWTLTDCFESRWLLRPEEAAAHLAALVERRAESAPG